MEFTPQFYDEHWGGDWNDMKIYGPTARHTRRIVLNLLRGLSFYSVLDAGCGTGVLLQTIVEKYPHVRLTGSEYSSQGIGFARKRLPNAEFGTLDLSKQCLDRKFDLITCVDVLEHIPDDRAALKNLLEMTGKYLILSVPLGPLFRVEEERLGHVHGYGRRDLEAKMREAGFEIIKAFQWGFPFYNIHRRIANRMPEGTTVGTYSPRKKLLCDALYTLFYLNVPLCGERYYLLSRPASRV